VNPYLVRISFGGSGQSGSVLLPRGRPHRRQAEAKLFPHPPVDSVNGPRHRGQSVQRLAEPTRRKRSPDEHHPAGIHERLSNVRKWRDTQPNGNEDVPAVSGGALVSDVRRALAFHRASLALVADMPGAVGVSSRVRRRTQPVRGSRFQASVACESRDSVVAAPGRDSRSFP
jgi:hypothetical protein